MLVKNVSVIIIVIITFFSCIHHDKNFVPATEKTTNIENNNSFIDLNKYGKFIRAKLVLYTQEKRSVSSNGEKVIRDIREGDFGIPDGENWLVEWGWTSLSDTTEVILYAIKNDTIVKRYYLGENQKWRNYSEYNIMDHIVWVGGGLGDKSGTLLYSGEFTRDNRYFIEAEKRWFIPADMRGQDYKNFFRYNFRDTNAGYELNIEIFGYDKETDNIKTHLRIPTTLIDRKNGPAPVSFTRYNGMYGVKVYVPERNSKWIFYIWDIQKRQFLEIGEVIN